MKSQRMPRPIPCIITALELIGLDDPTMPPGRVRQVLALVERRLADPDLARLHGSRLSLTGRHGLHVAPIKPSGMLPFHVMLGMVHLQVEVIQLGVLVCGAITIGHAAAQGTTFFGQGVDEAERLCKEVALVPRVIVHPRLLRGVELNVDLRAVQHTPMDELGYLQSLLRPDSDGLWFIDYLWAFRTEVDDPQQYLELLEGHRRLVVRKLEASNLIDGSTRAWTWLWRYHNLVAADFDDKWRREGQEIDELRVPAASPLVYNFPPSAKVL